MFTLTREQALILLQYFLRHPSAYPIEAVHHVETITGVGGAV